jgi:hypothetical protein
MIVHLCVGVGWKLDALGLFPYNNTLFSSRDGLER